MLAKRYKQYGPGGRLPIITNDLNDPKLKAYQDSTSAYNSKANFMVALRAHAPVAQLNALQDANQNNVNGLKPVSTQVVSDAAGQRLQKGYATGYATAQYAKPIQPYIYQPAAPVPAIKSSVPNLAAAYRVPQPQGSPIYGPANSLIGTSDGKNFTAVADAARTGVNKPDADLLKNPQQLNTFLTTLNKGQTLNTGAQPIAKFDNGGPMKKYGAPSQAGKAPAPMELQDPPLDLRAPLEQNGKQGEIRQTEPQGMLSKAWEVVKHPVGALAEVMPKGDKQGFNRLPDHFSNSTNSSPMTKLAGGTADAILGMPAQVAEAVGSTAKNLVHPLDTGSTLAKGAANLAHRMTVPSTDTPEFKETYDDGSNQKALGILGDAALAVPAAKQIGRILPELVPNAYKANPWAFKEDPDKYYRVFGADAKEDMVNNGVVRNRPVEPATEGKIQLGKRPTAYPSFSKGKVSGEYAKGLDGHYMISTDRPMGVSTLGRHGKGSTIFPVGEDGRYLQQFPAEETTLYKSDWLQRYKKVDMKANGGTLTGRYKRFASGGDTDMATGVGQFAGAASGILDGMNEPDQFGKVNGTMSGLSGAAKGAAAGASFGPWGAGIGAAVGLTTGLIGAHSANVRAQNLKSTYERNRDQLVQKQGAARISADPSQIYGNLQGSYYAAGGQLPSSNVASQQTTGGTATPLNSSAAQINGPSHAEGGVQLPGMGAEVEGGETTNGDYVYSDQLGFAKLHRPIAKAIGIIEKKAMSPERVTSLKLLKEKEQQLKLSQEYAKSQLGLNN